MHLSQVYVKNFRSIKELVVELSPGLNVVVGRNNIGKTNLLCAIMHALGPTAARGEQLWISSDDFHRESRDATSLPQIAITLTFSGLSEEQRAAFFEIVDFNLEKIDSSLAQVHFEASWDAAKRKVRVDRWGGKKEGDRTQVPAGILEALPVTLLPALRDAEAGLVPGVRNRLARLLGDLAERQHTASKEAIVTIFKDANEKLLADALIKTAKATLEKSTQSMAGTDYSASEIVAAEAKFEQILRTLAVKMADGPTADLSSNGLGYNNLLYIAVVLAHLEASDSEECPLLLVEEPEAHLHPQLTTLLGTHLANAKLQTIVTTHSPTLAASVSPLTVLAFHGGGSDGQIKCHALSQAGMTPKEALALQRMLDVTRASLYFAKGVILVEGISEAILLPVLAERLGHSLAKHHVSVIPIGGVAFETFQKLFQAHALAIPVAIVSDADPTVNKGQSWENDELSRDATGFIMCDRTQSLITTFQSHTSVRVFTSEVTLEYDLAKAAVGNAEVMARAWEDCFQRTPGTFTAARVATAGTTVDERALCAWRGICRASHTGSKAEFAQQLAARLTEKSNAGFTELFKVPAYIDKAIEYVISRVSPPGPTASTSDTQEQAAAASVPAKVQQIAAADVD